MNGGKNKGYFYQVFPKFLPELSIPGKGMKEIRWTEDIINSNTNNTKTLLNPPKYYDYTNIRSIIWIT